MSVSEINFCTQCGNSVKGSKYCFKCGNEVASTVLATKENNFGLKEGNQVKEKKVFNSHIEEIETDFNNDKISLDELPKKPSKDSSNNTKYKWGTFLGPYIFAIYTTLSIPPIEMAFDGFGGFITFFARLLPSFIATSFVAIMLVCTSLLIACLTFLIGKGKSFWNVAFILSIVISGMLLLTNIMGY